MFRNYINIALRSLVKYKLQSAINILGLALGFVMAILAMLYISNELSFDKWLPNSDRIYRIYRQSPNNPSAGHAYSPKILAPFLANNISGVEKATAVYEEWRILLNKGDQSLYVEKIANVDTSFFDVFQFPFLYGDSKTALDNPDGIILSERIAKIFFGDTNPVGQLIKGDGSADYMVTGVLKAVENKTYLDYEVYTPYYQTWMDQWLNNSTVNYVLKEENTAINQVAAKTDEALFPIYQREMNATNMSVETMDDLLKWKFQPLSTIHLLSKDINTVRASTGDIQRLYLFGIVAFIVLFIAIINYLNLATAKASSRAKEVGVRKVVGARRTQLIFQFLTEAIIQSLFALGLALIFTEFLLPFFNQITDRDLTFFGGQLKKITLPILGLSISIGILAGLYPAFVLSKFKTVKVLKGKIVTNAKGINLRKGLVITQFAMTVILMIVMTFVYRQINFMQQQDLGFEGSQVMSVEINRYDTPIKIMQRKQELLNLKGVESVTMSNNIPGEKYSTYSTHLEGEEGNQGPDLLFVTPDYLNTIGLEMKEGRFFSDEIASDTNNAFVVNEAFVKAYQIENPIGQGMNFVFEDKFAPIIGVVKDFHYESLENKIRPLALCARTNIHAYNYVSFKLNSQNIPQTLNGIKEAWNTLEPTHPIQYTFVDEKFNEQYLDHERFMQTIMYATFLAIFIAVLGLFGLASFMAEKRTKEIGVRKILGASTGQLIGLLVKDFMLLVFIAGLIAIPLGYWLVNQWLMDFAFRINITILPFLLALFSALILAVLTVSYQSIKVSRENPVAALKTE